MKKNKKACFSSLAGIHQCCW